MQFLSLLPAFWFVAGTAAEPADRVTWKWEKDSFCSLFQKLESSSTPVRISRSPGSDLTTVSWLVRTPNFFKGYYPGATVSLSNGASAKGNVRVYSAENRRYWVIADIYGRAFLDSTSGASSVAIEEKFGRFEARVQDLASAIGALRACEDKHLTAWGVDLPKYWALRSRPTPTVNLGELFSFADYPGVGMTKLLESRVVAKLMVDRIGRVTECSSPGHHDYPEFVAVICKRLIDKARFSPALDADGQPAAAPYITYARFSLAGY